MMKNTTGPQRKSDQHEGIPKTNFDATELVE